MNPRPRLEKALASTYTVEREVGRGGMASVFLARDLKHQRQVAIKVLDADLGALLGVERFLSEIRVTANLQHPNLLPLFDSGEAEGLLYYVMPYVAGETLRERLDRDRQLPVAEALRLGVLLGRALDYAHEHGVIHRDLKPENVLLQHGEPVIADFGIALAISNAGGARVTQTGLSLGTPQYMSPEQAAGDRAIDGRSDIYSLGAIIYEMLAGEPPHNGNTVQAIIAKVISEKPRPLRLARETVPPHVEMAIDKALAKLPADRFATAGAFVRALEGDVSGMTPVSRGSAAGRPWIAHPASIAALAALITLIALGAYQAKRPATNTERVVQFKLTLPPESQIRGVYGHNVAISDDGRRLAWVGRGPQGTQIWMRDLDAPSAKALAGTASAQGPQFSPDGSTIVFQSSSTGRYLRVSLTNGSVAPVFAAARPIRVAWLSSDSIIFSVDGENRHLYRGSLSGGTPERLFPSTADSLEELDPVVGPDHQTVFFASGAPNKQQRLAIGSLATRAVERTTIQVRTVLGYVAGQIIFAVESGAIMAVRWDPSDRVLVGDPIALDITARPDPYTIKAYISGHGDLAYVDDGAVSRPVLLRSGDRPMPFIRLEKEFETPRYSPDGSRIAVSVTADGRSDIWIYDVASGTLDRLTSSGTGNTRPEWSPDGKRVIFRSNRSGLFALWWQDADGSTPAERLSPDLSVPVQEGVMSPDGRTVLYRTDTQEGQARNIYSMSLTGDRTPKPYVATDFDELAPRFSPDGRWVAYVSNESGSDEVYVRPFPGPGGRILISSGLGTEPVWSRDGRQIYYRSLDAMMRASLSFAGGPVVTRRDTVATTPFVSNRFHAAFDVAPNGSLLVLEPSQPEIQPTIILNWARALEARFGTPR